MYFLLYVGEWNVMGGVVDSTVFNTFQINHPITIKKMTKKQMTMSALVVQWGGAEPSDECFIMNDEE